MRHIAPGTFASFWHNRVWRGTFAAPWAYYLQGRKMAAVFVHECLKLGRTLLKDLLVLTAFGQALNLTPYSRRGMRDFPFLLYVNLVQDVALSIGGFEGCRRLLRIRKRGGPQ